MKQTPLPQRDIDIIENAAYFTTFRFGGRGKRDRRTFTDLVKARTDAGSDARALVYAVSASDLSAHVPSYYQPTA